MTDIEGQNTDGRLGAEYVRLMVYFCTDPFAAKCPKASGTLYIELYTEPGDHYSAPNEGWKLVGTNTFHISPSDDEWEDIGSGYWGWGKDHLYYASPPESYRLVSKLTLPDGRVLHGDEWSFLSL